MLNEKILQELNRQITMEFQSEHDYIAMAAYCYAQNFIGAGHFFEKQAAEEKIHAMKIFRYIYEQNSMAKIGGLTEPKAEYGSLVDVFKAGLAHEQGVSASINKIMELAKSEKDFATESFLKWFVDEQVEEEDSFRTIIDKFELIGDDKLGLYLLDRELGERE